MIGDVKTYTLSENSFLRVVEHGVWIGWAFRDHRRIMIVSKIGQRYKNGTEWLIDFEAMEIEKIKATKA